MDHYKHNLWSFNPPMKDMSNDTLTSYIKRTAISLFEKQRERSQFAVIILCSKEDCDNELKEVEYSPDNILGQPLTNKLEPVMPSDCRDYDNYITARPFKNYHAETLLLLQLDYLYTSFVLKHGKPPCHIILYTWITPCSECATFIIKKLSEKPYSEIPRVVAHTTNTYKKGDDVRAAKERLREAGIPVLEVPHQKLTIPLQPQLNFF